MPFSRFFGAEPPYIRRARACLQEARMAALEHSMAAEHYQASAAMYSERARRLEEEIAMWQGQKDGAEHVAKPPLEVAAPSIYTGPARIDSNTATGVGPATVGIVRAA